MDGSQPSQQSDRDNLGFVAHLSHSPSPQDAPLVSVILTSYNYQHYVGEAITSVLDQTYIHLELIIVDDGSTDDSRPVIERATEGAKIPVRTIYKPNGGQASALNAGYQYVSGQIVCLLDSDDIWYKHKLEAMVAFMQLCPGGGVYQHQLDTADGPKKDFLLSADLRRHWMSMGTVNVAHVAVDHFVPTSGLAFRREVLDRVFPIPEALKTCPDGFLTRVSCMYGHVLSLPVPLGIWRDHARNAGKRDEFGMHEFWVPVLMPALNQYYEAHNIPIQLVCLPRPKVPLWSIMQAAKEFAAAVLRALLPTRTYRRLRDCVHRS